MAGFLGEEQVRQVKDRVDLVQLMGEYTPLRKSGSQFTGCCAFHQERTPSMYVYPDQQTYHCFGCGAHGDAISLIREKERLEFTDAVELLAKRVGIVLKRDKQSEAMRSDRDALVALYEFTTAFYERTLWESREAQEARDYLASRKLGLEVCKRFRLGWAPGSGQFVAEARRKNFSTELLLKGDLAVDRDGRVGDRFYQRVSFPICDRFGNPIAFSSRLLPAAEKAAKEAGRGVGKYINSTDTPLYHKGSTVFNLHRARTASRDRGRIIVMEGPTDVMAADQAGYGECVAVLGTALTADHAKQLGNLVGADGRVVLLLDGDRAGQASSIKAVRTFLSVGVPVRVAMLPDELDPAELLVESGGADGRAVFERVIADARADLDHLLRALAPRPYELDHRRRLAVADDVLTALRPMPDAALRSLHMRDVSDYFALERGVLEARLAGTRPPAAAAAEGAADAPEPQLIPELDEDRDAIMHTLARHPELRAFAADDLQLEPSHFPGVWDPIAAALLTESTDITALLAMAEVEKHPAIRAAVYRWVNTELSSRRIAMGDARQSLVQNAARLRSAYIKSQLLRLSREIADNAGDMSKMSALFAERVAYERQLNDLRGLSDGGPP
jgi:DNA primase